MKKFHAAIMASMLVFFAPVGASADELMYLFVEGETQGHIEGDISFGAEQDMISVRDWAMEFNVILNSTGNPTRRQEHEPFEITKLVDKASVPLAQAFINKENLETVELRIYEFTLDGSQEHAFTIKMEDAIISKMRQFANTDPSLRGTEMIAFIYDRITWTNVGTGSSVTDSW